MKTDWIPSREQDLAELAAVWLDLIGSPQKQTLYGWDQTDCNYTFDKIEDFTNKRSEYLQNPVKQKQMAKDSAKRAAIKAMRDFANTEVRFNKKMDDAARLPLGIHPKDTTPTTVNVPTAQAQCEASYPGPHLLMIHISMVPGTVHDPKADHGYRIYWGVLPHGGATVEQAVSRSHYLMNAPASGEELPHSRFTRRSKSLFEFPPEDSGKSAYFCIQLENSKGDRGPWGPMFSAVIP